MPARSARNGAVKWGNDESESLTLAATIVWVDDGCKFIVPPSATFNAVGSMTFSRFYGEQQLTGPYKEGECECALLKLRFAGTFTFIFRFPVQGAEATYLICAGRDEIRRLA